MEAESKRTVTDVPPLPMAAKEALLTAAVVLFIGVYLMSPRTLDIGFGSMLHRLVIDVAWIFAAGVAGVVSLWVSPLRDRGE